jgi:hypothetical protein
MLRSEETEGKQRKANRRAKGTDAESKLEQSKKRRKKWRARLERALRLRKDEVASDEQKSLTLRDTRIFEAELTVPRTQEVIDALPEASPEVVIRSGIESLTRSAVMMNEIVEETRRDQIEFKIRSRQIDRTLARNQEILDELIGAPK